MPKIFFTDPAGREHAVQVQAGHSLMEGAVQHGIPGIVAECGGNLACATCHVYIDERSTRVVGAPDPGGTEDEMLDLARSERLKSSRLSCQVVVTDAMDGLRVRIAPLQT